MTFYVLLLFFSIQSATLCIYRICMHSRLSLTWALPSLLTYCCSFFWGITWASNDVVTFCGFTVTGVSTQNTEAGRRTLCRAVRTIISRLAGYSNKIHLNIFIRHIYSDTISKFNTFQFDQSFMCFKKANIKIVCLSKGDIYSHNLPLHIPLSKK